ncbi:MAG: hypothetical protein ABI835_21185 [Chloroflexota bacterium]
MTTTPSKTITDVVTDFLASAPSLEALAVYRLPDDLQQYAHYLLDMNRAGSLSEQERRDMEEFREIDHLLTLVKAKAKLRLKDQG